MRERVQRGKGGGRLVAVGIGMCASLAAGCRTTPTAIMSELAVRGAIERYAAERSDLLARGEVKRGTPCPAAAYTSLVVAPYGSSSSQNGPDGFERTILTLGTFAGQEPASQPTTRAAPTAGPDEFVPPEGYWRKNLWHQMGHEAKQLGGRDFWRGFKTSFWDLENALLLTATMGASITIRETGVDGTVRNRAKGHRQLGDFDEPLQLLGHPGTHFAATGVLWLTSTLTKDVKQHEVAKALTQALAVNGVTTLALKAAANTRAPDNGRQAWPSGHTSSVFTAAAVLNEYYGPWVGIPSLVLAGLAGYQRIDSRVHDFSDVVFGGMLGYVIGTSIARDEKAKFPELFGMQVIPFADPETGASGLALLKRW